MRRRALLLVVALTGGCLAGGGPGTPTPATDTPATTTPTADTTTATPEPLADLLAPADCLTDAAPRPDPVDEVEPSPYPAPPATATRDPVVDWIQAFETAYFRNGLIADESGDDESTLVEASAYAEVRAVNRTPAGFVLRSSDSGARNYASGLHGDRWTDVGCVVAAERVVRVPLADREAPIDPADGTAVSTVGSHSTRTLPCMSGYRRQ